MHTPPQLLGQAWDVAALWDEQQQVGAGAVGQDPDNERLERLQGVGRAAGEASVLGLSGLPQTSRAVSSDQQCSCQRERCRRGSKRDNQDTITVSCDSNKNLCQSQSEAETEEESSDRHIA